MDNVSNVICKWVEDTSQCSKEFKENYNKDRDEGYFLEADFHYLANLDNLHNGLPIFPGRTKIEKLA